MYLSLLSSFIIVFTINTNFAAHLLAHFWKQVTPERVQLCFAQLRTLPILSCILYFPRIKLSRQLLYSCCFKIYFLLKYKFSSNFVSASSSCTSHCHQPLYILGTNNDVKLHSPPPFVAFNHCGGWWHPSVLMFTGVCCVLGTTQKVLEESSPLILSSIPWDLSSTINLVSSMKTKG